MADSSYLGIIILLGLGLVIAVVMVVGSWVFGPKRPTPYKSAPYECGMTPVGSARERFPVKFYLVAMLFIIFDIESLFLYPWYSVFNNPSVFANRASHEAFKRFTFFEVTTFFAFLVVGLIFVYKKGALDWDEQKDEASTLKIPRSPEPIKTSTSSVSFQSEEVVKT